MNITDSHAEVTDERTLIRLAQRGDLAARNELVTRNLGLASLLAKRYSDRAEHSDMFQEAVIGLMRAIDGFDLDAHSDVCFTTYASHWMLKGIYAALGFVHLVSIPSYVYDLRAAERRGDDMAPGHRQLLALARVAWSDPADIDEQPDPPYTEDQDGAIDRADQLRLLASALASLGPVELEVVKSRYGFGGARRKSLDDLGRRLHVPPARVREIEAAAVAMLATAMENGGRLPRQRSIA